MQIGVIAGKGFLPIVAVMELQKKGYRVITVALQGLANTELSKYSDLFEWINIGKAGEIIDFLKKNNVKEVILTGKVPKKIIFEREKIKPDLRAIKMLFSAKLRGDNELLKIVEKELSKEGIKIVGLSEFCPELLTPQGVLTRRKPSKEEWKDIEYGFKMAKKIGELDVGQTVVVKERSVIAVEAIEGTDETILRAGEFVKDSVVIKVSKPQQDLKLDPPAAGMDTIITMEKAKARVLALEAGKTLIVQRDKVIEKADEFNITVVGVIQH
ncbi:UDP-2,3-diacylglucosamine diphosphatase LpxI [Thermodesulfovibrio sp. 3907-1M]|uniref:UDP-2,3-diacylglucosamine diphosphatase LpxI n=1 Tax=Thermodesulfovibrio autotrophicus TaxID=3118333 RepID=A0AAU8GXY5_9BACT